VGDQRLDRQGTWPDTPLETRPCSLAVGAGLSVHHLVQRALGAGMQALGQLVEHVAQLVTPAGLLADDCSKPSTNIPGTLACGVIANECFNASCRGNDLMSGLE
jgi:hypothetical protein